MVITILAEPRSGSTNLANWFRGHKKFTILQEPLNIGMKKFNEYKGDTSPKEWKYNTPYLVIKEIYLPNADLTELIGISDKIILLYRENDIQQLESWLVANETKKWISPWVINSIKISNQQDKENYFYSLKNGFKNEYLNDSNLFKISYEELYYNNGLQKILDYLNIDCLKNENFPYGSKYRVERNIKSLI
jgi:hypothetical protein